MSLRDEDRLLRRTPTQAQSNNRSQRPAMPVHAPTAGHSRSRRLQENRAGAPAKQQGAAGSPVRVQRTLGSLLGHRAQPQGQSAMHQAAACAAPHIVPSGGRREQSGTERGASAKQVWSFGVQEVWGSGVAGR